MVLGTGGVYDKKGKYSYQHQHRDTGIDIFHGTNRFYLFFFYFLGTTG